MKIFWKKHKISVSIITFILIVAPLFSWATLFMVKRIQSKADLIQQKIIDNDLRRNKIEKIPQMEEANAEFERDKEYVGVILSTASKVDFIEYIEALAGETNNQVEIKILKDNQTDSSVKSDTKATVKKTKPDEKKSVEEQLSYKQYISMQVDLTGDYGSFLNFAHQLENNKYYVNILSLNLKTGFLDKENSSRNSGSNDVFFSPASSGPNSSVTEEVEKPVLQSTLTIIVYTE
jgi:hypothetical protein